VRACVLLAMLLCCLVLFCVCRLRIIKAYLLTYLLRFFNVEVARYLDGKKVNFESV
jgi:hypothetical protein